VTFQDQWEPCKFNINSTDQANQYRCHFNTNRLYLPHA